MRRSYNNNVNTPTLPQCEQGKSCMQTYARGVYYTCCIICVNNRTGEMTATACPRAICPLSFPMRVQLAYRATAFSLRFAAKFFQICFRRFFIFTCRDRLQRTLRDGMQCILSYRYVCDGHHKTQSFDISLTMSSST